MRAYFTRKPENLEEVKNNAKRAEATPVELNVIARVSLNLDQFSDFWANPLLDRDYLAPHAERSVFTEEGADCMMLECLGMMRIPVVLEGFEYGRYVGWLEGLA